MKSHIKTGPEI